MKPKTKVLSLLLILLLSMTSFAGSANAAMEDGLLPEEKEKVGSVELDAAKYPMSRYGMDTDPDESIFDFITLSDNLNEALMMVNSFIWSLNKMFYSITSWVVTEAFTMDVIGQFAGGLGKVIQSVAGVSSSGFTNNGLWPLLLPLIVTGLGVWVIYKGIVLRQSSVAISGLISSIVICSLSLGFYANAEKVLKNTNTVVTEIQNEVLSLSLSKTGPGNFNKGEGMAVVKNQLFTNMVKYPWMLMQFGSIDEEKVEKDWKKDGSRIDTLLKTKPLSEERQKAVEYEVKDLKNENMSIGSLTSRLVVLCIVSVLNGFLGTVMMLISGSIIFFSFSAMTAIALTPLTFLAAMIPSLQMTAIKALSKIAFSFYMKIALTLLAVILFVVSRIVYTNTDPAQGLILTTVIQIILCLAIWMGREELLRIVKKPFNGIAPKEHTPGLEIGDYKKGYFKAKETIAPITNRFKTPQQNPNSQNNTNKPKRVKPTISNIKTAINGNDVKQVKIPTPVNKANAKQINYQKNERTKSMPVSGKELKQAIAAKGQKAATPNQKVQPQGKQPVSNKTKPAVPKVDSKNKIKQPMKSKDIKPVKLKINNWSDKK